jgi:HSP20 family protein
MYKYTSGLDFLPTFPSKDSSFNVLWGSNLDNWKRVVEIFFNDFSLTDFSDIVRKDMYPVSDIYIGENGSVKIEIAVTGKTKEDISISVEDSILVIEGKEKKNRYDKKWRLVDGKIKVDPFKKKIRLSNKLDCSKAEASVENGLLTIIVPLKEQEEKKSKMIPIK